MLYDRLQNSLFLRIWVCVNSQTKGLEGGWKRRLAGEACMRLLCHAKPILRKNRPVCHLADYKGGIHVVNPSTCKFYSNKSPASIFFVLMRWPKRFNLYTNDLFLGNLFKRPWAWVLNHVHHVVLSFIGLACSKGNATSKEIVCEFLKVGEKVWSVSQCSICHH